MHNFFSEPLWIIALGLVFVVLPAAVLMATKRWSFARARRQELLADSKPYQFKDEDEDLPRGRRRSF